MGLGLSLAEKIVKLHNGIIEVTSTDENTEFSFSISNDIQIADMT